MRNLNRSARDFIPPGPVGLNELCEAARHCRGCELYEKATQTVFGAGPPDPLLVLVGEQPGDREDLAGEPFVGPAGKLLREVLNAAGIDEGDVYFTNAVKHFHWEEAAGRRLHKKPKVSHINACRPWLEAELRHLAPLGLACLGATAARAVFDRSIKIGDERGRLLPSPYANYTIITTHPSALLRIRDKRERYGAIERFIEELKLVHEAVTQGPSREAL